MFLLPDSWMETGTIAHAAISAMQKNNLKPLDFIPRRETPPQTISGISKVLRRIRTK